MAVRVTKPEFNVREKLTELDLPKGNHGTQLLKSNTLKETCELVGSGRRNLLINGGFDVWQRGTTFTTPSAPYCAADRWNIYRASSSITTTTRQSFTLGQQEVPGNPKYFMRVDNTPDADGTWIEIVQHVEDVTQFSDKWVTLSFWMRSNKPQENNEDYWGFYYNFGTGGSPSGSMMAGITPHFDIYTQWSYYEFPVYLPDIQNKTLGTDGVNTSSMKIHLLRQNAVAADTYYDIANVQLEFGRGATPFEKRSYGEELALCQRYYIQYGGPGGGLSRLPMMGEITGVGVAQYPLQFPVAMRGGGNVSLTTNGSASDYQIYSANASKPCTSVTLADTFEYGHGDVWGVRVNLNRTTQDLSVGHAAQAYGASTSILGFSREL